MDKIELKSIGGSMKKILGILSVSCLCILLGLSVKWSREQSITLAMLCGIVDLSGDML